MPTDRIEIADAACRELLDRILTESGEVARLYQVDRRHMLDTALIALLIDRLHSADKWDKSVVEQPPPRE